MFKKFLSREDTQAETSESEQTEDDETEKKTYHTHSISGDEYQFTATGSIRQGGVEVKTETESGPVAGPKIREHMENGFENPEAPLSIGYNVSTQDGFQEAAVKFEKLFQHLWACGISGAGKTTLLLNCMIQMAYAGYGFVYFDPKSEDSEELLKKLPKHRLEDVIWIEPGGDEFENCVQFNLLEIPDCDSEIELEREIEDRLENLIAIFDNGDYWGQRMNAILESMARGMMRANAEMDDPEEYFTVIDFYFILLNQDRRENFAEEVDDPFVKEFLNEIAEMKDDEVRPLITRVKSWVENAIIRKIIARRESTVDFQKAVDEDKIIIVRTPVANDDIKKMITLGTEKPIWTSVQHRNSDGDREPFFSIFDEADTVFSENLDVQDMLARARSMKMGVTIANQYPDQLDDPVETAVKNNVTTPMTFRIPDADEARPMMKKFEGFDVEDLTSLDDYMIWAKVPLKDGSRYSDPLRLFTFAPYPDLRTEEEAKAVVRENLKEHGAKLPTDDEIEQGIKYGEYNEIVDGDTDADEKILSDATVGTVLGIVYAMEKRDGVAPAEDVEERLEGMIGGSQSEISNIIERQVVRENLEDVGGDPRALKITPDGKETLKETGSGGSGGGFEHRMLISQTINELVLFNVDMRAPTQDGDQLPDAVGHTPLPLGGDTTEEAIEREEELKEKYPKAAYLSKCKPRMRVEVEAEGKTKPKGPCKNWAKAVNNNAHVFFVVGEGPDGDATKNARRINNILQSPPCTAEMSPKEIDPDRAFYSGGNLPETNEENEHVFVVHPDSNADLTWVEMNGEIILWESGKGPYLKFDSIEDFDNRGRDDFEAVYYKSEGIHNVWTNGEEYQYDSEEEFKNNWSRVKLPHIPELVFDDGEVADSDTFDILVGPHEKSEGLQYYEPGPDELESLEEHIEREVLDRSATNQDVEEESQVKSMSAPTASVENGSNSEVSDAQDDEKNLKRSLDNISLDE